MKAIAINQYGSPEELHEVDIAQPNLTDGSVLVKVAATSINPIEWKIRQGYLRQVIKWDFPIVLGFDLAGVVTELGKGVTKWNVGDRVAARKATTREGSYAEYAVVDEGDLALIPEELDFDVAAATPLAALTAWQALYDHAHIQPGQRILVHAGAGGVGSFAIQFAKLAGAYVITTARSENAALLRDLGADEVIDYSTTDFSTAIKDIDIAIDAIGGETQRKSLDTLSESGARTVLALGLVDDEARKYADDHQINLKGIMMTPNGKQLTEIFELIRVNKVRVNIATRLPFGEDSLREAHRFSQSGHSAGKIVIQFA